VGTRLDSDESLGKGSHPRYETANGLALDVQRFLNTSHFRASSEQALRFKKILLRNKLLFIGLGVIALLLIIGLIVVSASLARERWRCAKQSVAPAAERQNNGQTETAKSRQVTQLLKDMLEGVDHPLPATRYVMLRRSGPNGRTHGPRHRQSAAVEAEMRSLIGRLYVE